MLNQCECMSTVWALICNNTDAVLLCWLYWYNGMAFLRNRRCMKVWARMSVERDAICETLGLLMVETRNEYVGTEW